MAQQAVLRLVNSRGVQAGPNENALYTLKPRSYEPYNVANILKTGDYDVDMAVTTATEVALLIRQDEPLPMTVTAAFLDLAITEDT